MSRLLRIATFFALVVLHASLVSAQTFSTNSKVSFTAPSNAATVSNAQGLTYNLRIDGGSPIALTGVVCTAGTSIACSAALPSAAVPFLNVLGMRAATLSAADATAGEGPQSAPFTSAVKPTAPTAFSITQ